MKIPRLFAFPLCALLASACASYDFRAQDVLLRHDASADALELVVVSHGLVATGDSSVERAAEVAQGGRRVILFGWPFEFELAELEDELKESPHALAPRAAALVAGVQVAEAAAWLDASGEAVLYQRVRVPNAADGLALLSAAMNAESLDEQQHLDVARALGAETGALWEAFTREGRTWAAFEDGALVVRAPLAPEGAARCLEEVLKQGEAWSQLAPTLSALSITDDLATLTFRPDADGWIRFHVEHALGEEPLELPADVKLLPAPPEGVVALLQPPK